VPFLDVIGEHHADEDDGEDCGEQEESDAHGFDDCVMHWLCSFVFVMGGGLLYGIHAFDYVFSGTIGQNFFRLSDEKKADQIRVRLALQATLDELNDSLLLWGRNEGKCFAESRHWLSFLLVVQYTPYAVKMQA
jgi:hypothetical protein